MSDWSARRRWWLLAASLLVVKRRLLVNARNCLMPGLRSFRTVGAFCVTLFVTTASAFTEDSRIGILGDDDRRMIEERGTPWSAIGQINVCQNPFNNLLLLTDGNGTAPDWVMWLPSPFDNCAVAIQCRHCEAAVTPSPPQPPNTA